MHPDDLDEAVLGELRKYGACGLFDQLRVLAIWFWHAFLSFIILSLLLMLLWIFGCRVWFCPSNWFGCSVVLAVAVAAAVAFLWLLWLLFLALNCFAFDDNVLSNAKDAPFGNFRRMFILQRSGMQTADCCPYLINPITENRCLSTLNNPHGRNYHSLFSAPTLWSDARLRASHTMEYQICVYFVPRLPRCCQCFGHLHSFVVDCKHIIMGGGGGSSRSLLMVKKHDVIDVIMGNGEQGESRSLLIENQKGCFAFEIEIDVIMGWGVGMLEALSKCQQKKDL